MKKTTPLHTGILIAMSVTIAACTASSPANVPADTTPHSNSMGTGSDTSMTMNQMTQVLQGKTGNAFDKAFIDAMIVHHNGAIAMAKLAQRDAGHEEIKRLAGDIIAAQQKEINQMKEWQKEWKY
ncbi:MAG: uncharacterized protein JWM56_639 [Candidatus Peribacteria bacterium]|nr:uncharacterized protein [Candidatus Peribacteria bacterium]